jgi:hypothetical protein
MVYIKATKEAFADIGIIIDTERAIDSEYIKHMELLPVEYQNINETDARFIKISEIPELAGA